MEVHIAYTLLHIAEWISLIATFIFKVCMFSFFGVTVILGTANLFSYFTSNQLERFLKNRNMWIDLLFFYKNYEEIRTMREECDREEKEQEEYEEKQIWIPMEDHLTFCERCKKDVLASELLGDDGGHFICKECFNRTKTESHE